MNPEFIERIFQIKGKEDFCKTALDIFRFQAENNLVYNLYLKQLGRQYADSVNVTDIPFLPVGFFKRHRILTGDKNVEKIFRSSGTTGSSPGQHYIADLSLYELSLLTTFRLFYSDPGNYIIYALLPSYTGAEHSSLVFMVHCLIMATGNDLSGFYKDDYSGLVENINKGRESDKKLLLIGVSYALLDFAEACHPDLSDIIVMETGGMKGRRKEIIRQELHSRLKEQFNLDVIHSEYGMTELLSQAYSKGNNIFRCPPWMKILIRDPHDPLSIISETGRTGGINIIDLANVNTCSFIATDDIGKLYDDDSFEILGRLDNSNIRGCNLMIDL